MTESVSSLRPKFFEYLFGENRGHICIAYAPATKSQFKQAFFEWPRHKNNLETFVDQVSHGNNVWFCVSLLSIPKRNKENALSGSIVWADLDTIAPDTFEPPPSCVVSSSPGHYHVYWRMDRIVVPNVQEEYSKKLAYKFGADKSGWDITQLLRVPYTYNYKPEYERQGENPPMIEILRASEERIPVHLFDQIFVPDEMYQNEITTPLPMPDPLTLPNVDNILYRYVSKITPDFHDLYTREPGTGDDWSRKIWRFINICLEIDMELEEVFVVAQEAKCNKYERDERPLSHLWKDILKANDKQKNLALLKESGVNAIVMPKLIDEEKITNSFVVEYKDWATNATDAPEVYHELAAVILLSAILSPCLKLETSWGLLHPNLWGLILGESTLTRKTTAMQMMRNILLEIDSDLILASDASPEGLLTGLSVRPNQTSIFYRDEVAGLFESIKAAPYMSHMPEILTELYDVPQTMNKLLRKNAYSVTSPFFIFFAGGIKEKVYSLIDERYITSGFMPRFLIVNGDTTAEQRRRTGRPVPGNYEKRKDIVEKLADIRERYQVSSDIKLPSGAMQTMTSQVTAELTDDAWDHFSRYEYQLEYAAEKSGFPGTTQPTFTRLGFSLLKVAMLFSAYRSEPSSENKINVETQDVTDAATCIQKWGQHTVDFLVNSGKGDLERKSDKAYNLIKNKPGVYKAELYRALHFRSTEGKEILDTLSDRGLIYVTKEGRGLRIYPTVEAS